MSLLCPQCNAELPTQELAAESTLVECSACGTRVELVAATADWRSDSQPAEAASAPESKVSQQIGRFHVLRLVGCGAFGAVYEALDTRLDRIVALKLPRAAELTSTDEERFLREARAAAQLSHPNVVTVFESGRMDDGRPYLVSDFVSGRPLSEYIADHPLSSRRAVDLGMAICAAVAHAHQHGVVHRDLKPANVMITEEGQPKVTDFGLARRSSDMVTMTHEGAILGTPAYMSPEQARGLGHEADARSDVYSLGAMLFELLTRERPFRGNVRMVLKQVLDDEPLPPSRLTGGISRDLDTIVLKCLEKDPGRRYQTADKLRAELERVRRGEPIEARPISHVQRGWRIARCFPKTTALATLLVITFTAGFVGVFMQWRRAEAFRDSDRRSLAQVNDAIDGFVEVVTEDPRLNSDAQLQPVRHKLLADAKAHYLRFVSEHEHEPQSRQRVADAFYRLGRINQAGGELSAAGDELRRALALYEQQADDDEDGKSALGAASCHESLGIIAMQSAANDQAVTHFELALQGYARPDLVDPTEHALGTARCHFNLALLHQARGDARSAIAGFTQAMQDFERLAARPGLDPSQAAYARGMLGRTHQELGNLMRAEGQVADALTHYAAAVKLHEAEVNAQPTSVSARAELARGYSNLGMLLRESSPEEAAELLGKALDLRRVLAASLPHDDRPQIDLARSCATYGNLLHDRGEISQAEALYLESCRVLERVSNENPQDVLVKSLWATMLSDLGDAQRELKRLEAALATLERSVELHQQAIAAAPENPQHKFVLHLAYYALGRTLRDMNQPAQAAATARNRAALFGDDPVQLYNLACELALCMPVVDRANGLEESEAAELRTQLCSEAIAALEKSLANGFNQFDALSSDADLAPIRGDPRFAALLAKIPDDR